MKESLSKDWGLKLLALVVSILLWVVVINVEDPVDKRVIQNVPVNLLHGELITNAGKTYRVADDSKTVDVTVRAKQSVLRKIKVDDVRATADFMNIDGQNVPVEVSIPAYAKDIKEMYVRPGNIIVSVEAEKTKTFPITPQTSGSMRNGYVIGKMETDPRSVEISGPESVVSSISKVVAQVKVTGLSRNSELDAKLVMFDAAGTIIDQTRVKTNLGEDSVTVKIKVLSTKSVPVIFDTTGIKPAVGYKFSGVTLEPEMVQVAGSKEDLEKIEAINVPAEVLAKTGLTESVERTIDLSEYLPEGIKSLDETGGLPVAVSIMIEKYGTRTIQISAGSIALINSPKGFTASCEVTGKIEIVITGEDHLLQKVNLGEGDVYANLVSYDRAGVYDVTLQVRLPQDVELLKNVTVQVKLEESGGGEDG